MANIDNVHCWDISNLNYGDIFHTLASWANISAIDLDLLFATKHSLLEADLQVVLQIAASSRATSLGP